MHGRRPADQLRVGLVRSQRCGRQAQLFVTILAVARPASPETLTRHIAAAFALNLQPALLLLGRPPTLKCFEMISLVAAGRLAAARAADRGAIAVHGRDAALTNYTLACYGPAERQRSGDDLAQFLAALRAPPLPLQASYPSPYPNPGRCGRCAACRQRWRRDRHGRRLRCEDALAGGAPLGETHTGNALGRPADLAGMRGKVPTRTLNPAAPSGRRPAAAAAAAAAAGAAGGGAGACEGLSAARAEPGGRLGRYVDGVRATELVERAMRTLYMRQEAQRRMDAALACGARLGMGGFCAWVLCVGNPAFSGARHLGLPT